MSTPVTHYLHSLAQPTVIWWDVFLNIKDCTSSPIMTHGFNIRDQLRTPSWGNRCWSRCIHLRRATWSSTKGFAMFSNRKEPLDFTVLQENPHFKRSVCSWFEYSLFWSFHKCFLRRFDFLEAALSIVLVRRRYTQVQGGSCQYIEWSSGLQLLTEEILAQEA